MASSDGSILIRTKVDTNGIKTGTKTIKSGVDGINSSVMKLGAVIATVFSVAAIINFGKSAVKTASELSNAMIGLKSIVEGTGNSFQEANDFIQSYISDGLVPATNAITTYKNLLMRGYTTDQIEKVMIALKDSAAFGRQASLSLGDAVQTASEGLKNENSILVDNAGVTKNVAKMWEDYAKSIGVSTTSLTKQQKIQAEVNGIMEETRFQTGDAAKVAATWSGQVSALNVKWQQLLALVGGRLIQVLTPVVTVLNNILTSAIAIGNALATVFGWDTEISSTTSNISTDTSDTANSQDDLTNSTKATNSALKKQLAYFDDINVLASQSASGVGTSTGGTTGGVAGGGVVNTKKTTQELTALEKKMLDFLNGIKKAWNTDADFSFIGISIADSVNSALDNIDWSSIKENSYKVGKAIATFLDGAIKETDWSKVGQSIGESVNTALSFANGVIKNFDFKEAGNSFSELMNNTLNSIDWEKLGNTVSDGMTGALEYINSAIETFDWDGVGNDLGVGIASIDYLSIINGIGEAIVNFVFIAIPDFVGGIVDGISKQVTGTNANTAIANAFGALFANVFSLDTVSKWWNQAKTNFDLAFNGEDIGTNIILGILNGLNAGIGFLLLPFTNFIANVLELFGIHSPSTVFYDIAMNIILGFVNGLNDFGAKVFEWFSVEKWTTIGNNMQEGIKAGFKGVVSWTATILNGIVKGFEDMINYIVDGANTLVNKFNSLPSALRLGFTASNFDRVSLGNIQIPALAQGAVIPPNKQFMAVLGDQTSGTNIEAPLDTIKQAVAEVLSSKSNSLSTNNAVMQLDGQTFARLVVPYVIDEMKRSGYNVNVLGVS